MYLDRTYKHLGTEVSAGGAMGPAVAARARAHAQAMAPLRRCVCRREAVSVCAKLTYVDALATSRLCYAMGVWDALTKGQEERLQAALVSGYRCAMSMPHKVPLGARFAAAEVLVAARRPAVPLRATVTRLRL